MDHIFSVARRYRVWLIVGFLVHAAIFSLDNITASLQNAGDYTPFAIDRGISDGVYDEGQEYSAAPKRFSLTGSVGKELDLFELRDQINGNSLLPAVVLGLLAKASGGLEMAWMIAHAIFPAIAWAVFFAVSCAFCGSAPEAALAASLASLIPFGPRNFLGLGAESLIQPLELTRMPAPALAFPLLLLAIALLAAALAKPSRAQVVFAGVVAGTLFYSYYFYWIAFFAGVVPLFAAFLWLRRRTEALTLASVVGIGFLEGIPFILITLAGMHTGQRDLMLRMGSFTRHPYPAGLLIALILLAALAWFCRWRNRGGMSAQDLFITVLLSTIAGAALGINFHLLSGYDAQHLQHFLNRAIQPLFLWLVLLLCGSLAVRASRLRKPLARAAAGLLVLLLLFAGSRQITVGAKTAYLHKASNPEVDILNWARGNLPVGTVIGSSDDNLLTLIPPLTGDWTFVPRGARTLASVDEILTRYFLICKLEGKDWERVSADLLAEHLSLRSNVRLPWVLLEYQRRPDSEALRRWKALWDALDLRSDLAHRRLDYLIVPRNSPPLAAEAAGYRYRSLYRNTDWDLLQMLPLR